MHELGVTFHIMDQVEEVAQESDVERVRKVVLELGEVSTVIESYLQSCWTWAAKKRSLFEKAELIVETLPELPTVRIVGKPIPRWSMGKPAPFAAAGRPIFCTEMSSTLRK